MSRKEAILNLRKVLVQRRDVLRRTLAGGLSSLKKLKGQAAGDVVDAALDTVQDEINSQLAEVESRELALTENALKRMRDGQYGLCELCGEAIPMARLLALPYATSCINCQRLAEQQGVDTRSNADWGRLIDHGTSDNEATINDIELDVS